MQHVGLALAGVIVVLLAAGWSLGRFGVEWGAWLSVAGSLLARLIAGLVLAWTAIRAAERGGVWFPALAVVLGFLAVVDFAMLAVMTWGLVKFGPNPDEEEPHAA